MKRERLSELLERTATDDDAPSPFGIVVNEIEDLWDAIEAMQGKPVETPAYWPHVINEWADVAYNGVQWLRNIRDGISTAEEAIENMNTGLAHCQKVTSEAKAKPTSPVPEYRQWLARNLLDANMSDEEACKLVAFHTSIKRQWEMLPTKPPLERARAAWEAWLVSPGPSDPRATILFALTYDDEHRSGEG